MIVRGEMISLEKYAGAHSFLSLFRVGFRAEINPQSRTSNRCRARPFGADRATRGSFRRWRRVRGKDERRKREGEEERSERIGREDRRPGCGCEGRGMIPARGSCLRLAARGYWKEDRKTILRGRVGSARPRDVLSSRRFRHSPTFARTIAFSESARARANG